MRGIKEAHWGLASVGELDRKLDPMRKLREQQERMDRMLDPMRKLSEQQERMDRMLDPMRGLMEHQRATERRLGATGGLGEADAKWDRDEIEARQTATQDLGHHVQFSRGRVLPQDTGIKGAAEEKSTPETLTTACHAASWFARSWRCGWRCTSIGPESFP